MRNPIIDELEEAEVERVVVAVSSSPANAIWEQIRVDMAIAGMKNLFRIEGKGADETFAERFSFGSAAGSGHAQ